MKRVAAGLGLIAFLMILAGGSLAAQVGERPRDTDFTEDAEDRIEDAEDTDDEAEDNIGVLLIPWQWHQRVLCAYH